MRRLAMVSSNRSWMVTAKLPSPRVAAFPDDEDTPEEDWGRPEAWGAMVWSALEMHAQLPGQIVDECKRMPKARICTNTPNPRLGESGSGAHGSPPHRV